MLCVELVLVFELRRDSHIFIESFHARYKVGLSTGWVEGLEGYNQAKIRIGITEWEGGRGCSEFCLDDDCGRISDVIVLEWILFSYIGWVGLIQWTVDANRGDAQHR